MCGLSSILVALPLSTVQNLTEDLMTTAPSHDNALKKVGVTAMSYNIITLNLTCIRIYNIYIYYNIVVCVRPLCVYLQPVYRFCI